MKLLSLCAFLSVPLLSAAQAANPPKVVRTNTECHIKNIRSVSFSNARYEVTTSEMPNHSWGYEIYADGQLCFRQDTCPGKQEGEGFRNRELAEKTAQLVIQKLKIGNQPPTITEQELSELLIK